MGINYNAALPAVAMEGKSKFDITQWVNELKSNLGAVIKQMFANGEQGFAYDPNDLSTMYQDAAGTVPVTGAGQPVGLMLDKSKGLALGSNLNATGSSGWYAGAEWGISGDIANLNAVGTYTNLDKVMTGSAVVGRFYEIKVKVLSITGQLRCIFSGNGTLFLINTAGDYKFYIYAAASYGLLRFQAGGGVTASISLSSISVKELSGNHAYQTTSASRPLLQRNATTGAYYLAFDGTDDFLVTNSIDFTATDKLSLFAGIRKLSTVDGMVCEFSASVSVNNGSFYLASPAGQSNPNQVIFVNKGTVLASANNPNLAPPLSLVITCKGGISSDTTYMKANNTLASSAADLGTGNYGNYPLYIGRRGGTSIPFNGHLYSLIGIARLSTNAETTVIEKAIAKNVVVTI